MTMPGAKATKLILSAGALLLFVLLFIAPKTAPTQAPEKISAGLAADNNASLQVYVNMAAKSVDPGQKKILDRLLAEKKFDSLSLYWDKAKRPDIAAVYAEEKASSSGNAEDWMKAGNRYYYAVQFVQDKTEIPVLYQCAMRSFSKVLKLQPASTDAKIMLASCYVEGTADPMQGISMLKEVEKADSNNAKVHLTFAFFSVRSGQLDKAIARFNKVLEIDSNYIEVYLHLADVYEQRQERNKTVEMLRKYADRTPDPTEKAEVNKYIEQKMREQ